MSATFFLVSFLFCSLVNGRVQAKVEWLGKLEEVVMLPVGLCNKGWLEPQFLHFFLSFLFGKTCVHQN